MVPPSKYPLHFFNFLTDSSITPVMLPAVQLVGLNSLPVLFRLSISFILCVLLSLTFYTGSWQPAVYVMVLLKNKS